MTTQEAIKLDEWLAGFMEHRPSPFGAVKNLISMTNGHWVTPGMWWETVWASPRDWQPFHHVCQYPKKMDSRAAAMEVLQRCASTGVNIRMEFVYMWYIVPKYGNVKDDCLERAIIKLAFLMFANPGEE